MKKNFTELLDQLEPAELDGLLEGLDHQPLDGGAAARIRQRALAGAGLAERRKTRPRRKLWGTLAACLALAVCIGAGAYAYAAENRTYNEAVRFFSENSLSAEGLTRGEIKAVYRDITTETFAHSKTAEVIRNSVSTARVDGVAIPQELPEAMTPEQVQTLWRAYHLQRQAGIHYALEYVEMKSEDGVYLGWEKCLVGKYDGETLLWQFPITAYLVNRYQAVSDGVVVWGQSDITTSWQNEYAWMTKLDDSGREVWTRCLDNGFRSEYICAVLEEEDGGCAVVSRGDGEALCLSRYTAQGERTLFQKNVVGNYGVGAAARLGDGYLVQLSSWNTNEHARIVKLDRDGVLTEDYSYSADDAYYYITDMAEFGGKVYLSAYAVPALAEGDSTAGGRYEIAGILNGLFRQFESGGSMWDISDEELTPLVRANYTALLLVCEPRGGELQTFYSAEGSLGGKLAVSDKGELLWDVESIASTFFSPATSSFSIGGTCQVYRYAFDGGGALVSQVKTDETTVYRR